MITSLLERNVVPRNVGDPQPLIAKFWSEKIVGFDVWRHGQCEEIHFGLEPDQDKGSDMHKKL